MRVSFLTAGQPDGTIAVNDAGAFVSVSLPRGDVVGPQRPARKAVGPEGEELEEEELELDEEDELEELELEDELELELELELEEELELDDELEPEKIGIGFP